MSDEPPNNLITLADRRDDNKLISVEVSFHEILQDMRLGKIKATKALVILLDDTGDLYDPSLRLAGGLKVSQGIALTVVAQQQLLEWMKK